LLQQYQSNFPTVQLKIPLYGAFPSIEMKNTSDIGLSVVLIFSWDLFKEFMNSLRSSMPNVAN
jgi:hypothetical protein